MKTRLRRYKPSPGERRGWLTFVGPGKCHKTSGGNNISTYILKCDCGAVKTVKVCGINEKWPRSCGCRRYVDAAATMSKPLRKSATHVSWASMMSRCSNPKQESSKYYLGKGVKVCERWESFDNFLADMGERPAGTTLDRINSRGDYEPSNCRWATHVEQQNNRGNNRWLSLNGETKTLAQWSRHVGLKSHVISKRLARNWTLADALGMSFEARTGLGALARLSAPVVGTSPT